MIPFSPRKREREALENTTFTFDTSALERLEAAVCAYHGCRFAVALATPEAALTAILASVGVHAGDELILGAMAPLHHYTAAARLQARIRYGDIRRNGTLCGTALQTLVSAQTKAVVLAAFEGIRPALSVLPESVTAIRDLSSSLAPASGAGTAVWSLESLMPEGLEKTGFVLTDDADTAARVRFYRAQGRKAGVLWNYDLVLPGADAGLGALAASVALKQMTTLRDACTRRREHAEKLDGLLCGSALFDLVTRGPEDIPNSYPLLLAPQLYCPKEDIFTALRDKRIDVAVCCKPVYKTTAFREEGTRLPVTEDVYKALLQLPCHQRLRETETGRIAAALREAVDTYAYRGCRF